MLEFLSLIIKFGMEFLFIIMLLTNFFQLERNKPVIQSIFIGSLSGTMAAIIVYLIKKYLFRLEYLDVVEKGLLFFLIIVTTIWLASHFKFKLTKYGTVVLFLFSLLFSLGRFEYFLLVTIPQLSMINGMNSEWIGKVAVTVLTAIILIVMGYGMKRIGPKLNLKFVFIMFMIQALILFAKELVELLQLLLNLQIIPLTMWMLDILAPIVNNKDVFFYVLTAASIYFLFGISIYIYRFSKEQMENFLNPAEKRKWFIQAIRIRRWFYSFVIIQICFFSFLASAKIIEAKGVSKDPPIKVHATDGQIHLTKSMSQEKGLNVYSYLFEDNSEVRFITVGKTNNNFGVALDACAICGVAGYYQKGDQIICKRCNSVININTIGFTGGCNPIPIEYENNSNSGMTIPVSELEKSKAIFQ